MYNCIPLFFSGFKVENKHNPECFLASVSNLLPTKIIQGHRLHDKVSQFNILVSVNLTLELGLLENRECGINIKNIVKLKTEVPNNRSSNSD